MLEKTKEFSGGEERRGEEECKREGCHRGVVGYSTMKLRSG